MYVIAFPATIFFNILGFQFRTWIHACLLSPSALSTIICWVRERPGKFITDSTHVVSIQSFYFPCQVNLNYVLYRSRVGSKVTKVLEAHVKTITADMPVLFTVSKPKKNIISDEGHGTTEGFDSVTSGPLNRITLSTLLTLCPNNFVHLLSSVFIPQTISTTVLNSSITRFAWRWKTIYIYIRLLIFTFKSKTLK